MRGCPECPFDIRYYSKVDYGFYEQHTAILPSINSIRKPSKQIGKWGQRNLITVNGLGRRGSIYFFIASKRCPNFGIFMTPKLISARPSLPHDTDTEGEGGAEDEEHVGRRFGDDPDGGVAAPNRICIRDQARIVASRDGVPHASVPCLQRARTEVGEQVGDV